MKKTIKLTEADILKMVKRILEEQISFSSPNGFSNPLIGSDKLTKTINKPTAIKPQFNKAIALSTLKKLGYKQTGWESEVVYMSKTMPNGLTALIVLGYNGDNKPFEIEFYSKTKDDLNNYLERGNHTGVEGQRNLIQTIFSNNIKTEYDFTQEVKYFETVVAKKKEYKVGPTNAADVTAPRQSSLNETIKRHLREVAEEPVITGNGEHTSGFFTFAEGKAVPTKVNGQIFDNALRSRIVNALAKFIQTSVPTMQKFLNDPKFKLPKFIQVNVGTSHTASPEANVAVATQRGEYLRKLISDALIQLKIRPDVVYQIVTTNTDAQYQPSKLDTSFYDARVLAPNADERFGEIRIKDLSTQGLNTGGIQNVQHGLNDASSIINNILIDNVEEDEIVYNIKKLQTYSDIQDLDNAIKAQGHEYDGLEDFLNQQLFDDDIQMTQVAKHLNKCAMKSSLPDQTIRLVKDSSGHYKISINLTAK